MAGLDTTGFIIKTQAEILADMQASEQSLISPSVDVQPTALLGILNGIMSAAIADLWLLALALYTGMDPDNATGDQLGSLALLVGTQRRDATFTRATNCTVNVNAGFSCAAGDLIANVTGNTAVQYTNLEAIASVGGGDVTGLTFEATTSGPIQCLSGTLIQIASPFAGWNSITNVDDGTPGTDIESDPSLRLRRDDDLSAAGSSTADAIRADVLNKLPLTTTCTVLHNDGDSPDANGLPPHSLEVIARLEGATTDDNIALATLILNSKAAGINTYGLDSEVVKDSQGTEEEIFFTRPTDIPIYINITVLTDPDTFPGNGAALIKEALANYGKLIVPGSDVYIRHLQAQVFDYTSPTDGTTLTGILDVTVFQIGTAPSPSGTSNIAIGIREVATFSTGDIAVTVTP